MDDAFRMVARHFSRAEFEDVSVHVVKPKAVWLKQPHGGSGHVSVGGIGLHVVATMPYVGVLSDLRHVVVAPIVIRVGAAPTGDFPLLDAGQANLCPFAVFERVVKADRRDRMVHFVFDAASGFAVGESPVGGSILNPAKLFQWGLENHPVMKTLGVSYVVRRFYECFELSIGGFVNRNLKGLQFDFLDGSIQPVSFSNLILTRGNRDEVLRTDGERQKESNHYFFRDL